jgi:ATP-binding cassette subfamily B protein RaxB
MRSANPIQNALTQSIVSAFIDGLMATFTGIVIFAYSIQLGFIVLASVLLLLLANLSFYPLIRRKQEEVIICDAKKDSFEIECIRAISTIKLYGAQPHRLSSWRNLFVADINASISVSRYQIILSTINDIITSLQTILIVYFSAKLVIDNQVDFSMGMLIAFMLYRQYFTGSIVSLMEKMVEFRLLSLHLERIAEITETDIEEKGYSIESFEPADTDSTYIEFKDVYFRFSNNDPWVLCGVDLKINIGDFIVLTGDSGGGKTTLIKLLLGLYKPTKGEILVNGNLLTGSVTANWRKKIGVVMQDDQLLTGTIVDNISFFDEELDMAKAQKAARFACIHDVISAMPMKYLSYIGDMGSMLSAGQKQRILLARAIYREPESLFLDEGTVNIDKGREETIIKSLGQLKSTKLIVTHSDAFFEQFHRNLHLVAGKVVEK